MISLYILIILGAILLWFLVYKLFDPIGKLVHKFGKGAIDAMKEENEEAKKQEEK